MRDMRQRAACGASAASIASDARRHRSLGDVSLAYAFLDATQLATLAARHLVGALSSSFLRCSFLSSDGLFSLTGADPFSGFHRFIFIFTFRQRNECKRERWDRILAQVTFFNEVPCPPALRFTISWRTGGLKTTLFLPRLKLRKRKLCYSCPG